MVVCWVHILLLSSFLDYTLSQCNENCVNEYQSLVHDLTENTKIVFDDIQNQYGENEELDMLLRKLNESLRVAEENIKNVEDINEEFTRTNNNLNAKMHELLEKFRDMSRILEDLNLSDVNMLLKNTSRSSNIDIHPDFVSEGDFVKLVNELTYWYRFLGNADKNISDADITNIPNSLQDDLYMLEILLGNVEANDCYEKFQDDLKLILGDLPKLLNLENIYNDVLLLEADSKRDKNVADHILNQTEDILNKEKELQNVFILTNDTLNLAEETDAVKRLIDELAGNKQNVPMQNKLDELEENFNNKLHDLLKKYEVDKYWNLLNELEEISIQANGKKGSISEMENEIEEYIDDIECYTLYIANCRYKTPLESNSIHGSPECDKKIKSLSLE